MPPPENCRYRAFISYSHQDADWSRKLLQRLESYRIPAELMGRPTVRGPVPPCVGPVFRDQDEFAAGGPLKAGIVTALEQSAALVVICSPAAAGSEWVNREIELFRSLSPDRPIIPVIVAGSRSDSAQECFPPALRAMSSAGQGNAFDEPLAADVRIDEELALAKIVGGMLGLPVDDLYARAARARRQRMRRWIAGLSATTALLFGLLVWAEYQRQRAEQNLAVALDITSSMTFSLTNELRTLKGVKLDEIERILGDGKRALDTLEPPPLGSWIARRVRAFGNWLFPPANAQDARIERNRAGIKLQESKTQAARGNTEQQEKLAAEAIDILRRLITRDANDIELPRELSVALNAVGEARASRGNTAGATAAFEESLRLMEGLQQRAPLSPLMKRDTQVPLVWLGNLRLAAGEYDAAEAYYRRALAMIEQAMAADFAKLGISDRDARAASIDKGSLERELSITLNKLGDVAEARGDANAALALYGQALDIRRRLAKTNPDDALLFRQLNVSRANVGRMHFALGDLEGAAAAFEEAVVAWREQVASDPGNAQHKRDLSIGLDQLSATLLQLGKMAEARTMRAEDLALTRDLHKNDPGNVEVKQELLMSLLKSTEIYLLPPPEPRRACVLLTEAEGLAKAGVPAPPLVVDQLKQALAAANLAPGSCGP